uniref:CS domain-containing protein n=1 Tax=Peronospora matthiolae TaxID=2874970 RepID=A0AAV1UDB7_9STRA
MSAVPGRFDALLTQLAQQHGGVESLLDSIFDFLHRKTDFYVVSSDPARHKMGFLPGQAQQKVLEAFQKHSMKSLDERHSGSSAVRMGTKTEVTGETTAGRRATDPAALTATMTRAPATAITRREPQLTEDGKQVPVGNGGVAGTYTWTQTLEEVSIQVEFAQGTQAKDLDCQIGSTRLRVALKSDQTNPLIEGEFLEKVRLDESTWSVESSHTLSISLEKVKRTWWACAIKGGPEIDTSQVDSRRNIQEYDEATQGAIRKAMYDQRRQQLNGGLPLTSEERILQEAKDLPGSPFLPSTQP